MGFLLGLFFGSMVGFFVAALCATAGRKTMSAVCIVVTKRSDDYHACLADHSEFWDCGKTPNAAIGALLRTHPKQFNVAITDVR